MSSESNPDPTSEEHAAQSPAARPRAPRRWGPPERNRLLIWVAIAFLAPLPIALLFHIPFKLEGSLFTVRTELPIKALSAIFALFGTWIVSRMEKRPLADYGAPPRQALGLKFWEGIVWGFAALSVILGILHVMGHFQVDSAALAGPAIYRYAFGWGLVFLAVAIHEEFAFRCYLLFSFSKRMRFWRASIFLSLLFGAAHLFNPGETPLGVLHVVMIGLVFCFTIRRTGTLWFAVGYHAAWDWAETFFYGTPDSGLLGAGRFLNTSVHGPTWLTGGSAGPEGSIVSVVVVLLIALLIHLRFPNVIYPDRPV